MNTFDATIIHFLNSFSRKSWLFDYSVSFIADNTFIRAGLITPMLVWLWFRADDKLIETRESVIATTFFTVVALVFVKILRFFLPFRPRPLHNPDLVFNLPFGVDSRSLFEWSSFPSDTAVFFFAMSIGLFHISRFLGSIAIFYSFVAACLTRIYLGYHYPTDILGGMIIGIIFGSITAKPQIRKSIAYFPMIWMRHHRQAFYTCFFIVFVELTNIFDDIRQIILYINNLISL
ncbi:MAG TPA: phosphatase PAP2 family protein [Methylobacter sp.]|jgi:undecaprenyl-diphosphatase